MPYALRAIAFDLDYSSLVSLRAALPGWYIDAVKGSSTASIAQDWNPGKADLLVVQARDDVSETLGLCRFLVYCEAFSTDFRKVTTNTTEFHPSLQRPARRIEAPLLVLVPSGRHNLVGAVLEAGATSCLTLPIHAKDIASMLVRAGAGNQPGRHTLNLEHAQVQDRWRDDGGQG